MVPTVEFGSLLVRLLLTLGVPVVVVLFYLEGLIVGKVARPGAIFVLYTVVTRPERVDLALLAGLCAVATVLGQWTLYRGVSDEGPELVSIRDRISLIDRLVSLAQTKVETRFLTVVDRLFARFGGVAFCVAQVLPGVRCVMSIPAGITDYPVERFLVYSLAGNLLYMGVLIAIARGILGISQFLPWP